MFTKPSSTEITFFFKYRVDNSSFLSRKLKKITTFLEENKTKFTELDLQDVKVREKLKHAKSKTKKLEKQLQKDKEKVV